MAREQDVEARERAIAALAAGGSVAESAKGAGYSAQHLRRLMREENFAAAVERARASLEASRAPSPETAAVAREQLALDALEKIVRNPRAKHGAQIQAAKALLAHIRSDRDVERVGGPAAAAATKKPEDVQPPAVLRGGGAEAVKRWLGEAEA